MSDRKEIIKHFRQLNSEFEFFLDINSPSIFVAYGESGRMIEEAYYSKVSNDDLLAHMRAYFAKLGAFS